MTTTTHLERTPIPQARRAQRQCMPLPLATSDPAPAAQIDSQTPEDAEQSGLPEWADYLAILLLAVVAIQITILVVFNIVRVLWLW